MSTIGRSGEPDYGWVAISGAGYNQFCIGPYTAPDDIIITDIGCWLRGYGGSCSFRGVIWSSTRNSVLGQTGLQTASSASGSVSASSKYEAAVSKFEISKGTDFYIGFTRNYSGGMQFSFDNGGSGYYKDDEGDSTPGGMTGESHVTGVTPAFYALYTLARPDIYVRRSGSWADPSGNYVRRSGSWESIGPDGYVRRSGVWVKA